MSVDYTVLLKISLVVFIVGSLLGMGLRLNLQDALRGLGDFRFVLHTLIWGFAIGPALAVVITRLLPLAQPYAMGLLLIGMAPCTALLPVMVKKVKGDMGYAAAFMILTAVGTILFMPFAVPVLVKGLAVRRLT